MRHLGEYLQVLPTDTDFEQLAIIALRGAEIALQVKYHPTPSCGDRRLPFSGCCTASTKRRREKIA